MSDQPTFSLTDVLNISVRSLSGESVAVLKDVICNKDSGRITYFILSTGDGDAAEAAADGEAPLLYAVHHSYFYFSDDRQEELVFNPKLGNDQHGYYPEVPDKYGDDELLDVTEFNRNILSRTGTAGHRSDND